MLMKFQILWRRPKASWSTVVAQVAMTEWFFVSTHHQAEYHFCDNSSDSEAHLLEPRHDLQQMYFEERVRFHPRRRQCASLLRLNIQGVLDQLLEYFRTTSASSFGGLFSSTLLTCHNAHKHAANPVCYPLVRISTVGGLLCAISRWQSHKRCSMHHR